MWNQSVAASAWVTMTTGAKAIGMQKRRGKPSDLKEKQLKGQTA